jgi:hypothetical protein
MHYKNEPIYKFFTYQIKIFKKVLQLKVIKIMQLAQDFTMQNACCFDI